MFEAVLHALPEGIMVIDAQARIRFVNRAAEQITGWTTGDAVGRDVSEVLAQPADAIHALIRGSRLMLQDVECTALSFTEADEPHTALVLRPPAPQDSDRALHSYFLANITHEFRTPLAGLNASLELLMDEIAYLSPAEVDELLSSIHLSAAGLQALVDNLLESVNIEAGHFALSRRPVHLNRVLAEAIRLVQPLLDRRRQLLSLTEPLRLPRVLADPTRLTQVVINLLSNASKYSPLDSTIEVSLAQDGDRVRVAVADQGPGVPLEDRGRLFRRFVRSRSSEQAGIGLGLSVVRRIIEEHHGAVGVEDRPGGGAVFWFTLPLAEG